MDYFRQGWCFCCSRVYYHFSGSCRYHAKKTQVPTDTVGGLLQSITSRCKCQFLISTVVLHVSSGVLVVMVGVRSPLLLWSPPEWLSPWAVLVLVAAQTCSARQHFQSPLLRNKPSVALLCLNHKSQTPDSTYSVVTHLPMSINSEPLSLGTWHPDTFSTLDDLFHDRYQDFSGTPLRATVSIFDKPAVFQRDDGVVDGFSVRILSALASWLNFTYSFNIVSCKLISCVIYSYKGSYIHHHHIHIPSS